MRIDMASGHLLLRAIGGVGQGKAAMSTTAAANLSDLARRAGTTRSALQAGIGEQYKPVFRAEARYQETARVERRTSMERREVFEEQAVEETRNVMGERDVFAERIRYVSRDVIETQDVFEDRPVLEAEVEGTKSLTGLKSLATAGVGTGTSFSVAVGDDPAARVTFKADNKIAVTQNGTTVEFKFNAGDGSFTTALLQGLNSIDGLSAALTADGRLEVNSGAETLTLANVTGTTGLSGIGLRPGATDPELVGYERVKTGTRQAVVGTEQVASGTEMVVVGREAYVAGTERVRVGSQKVKVGEETVAVSRLVKVGTDRLVEGYERKTVGLERAGPSLVAVASEAGRAAGLRAGIVDVVAKIVKSRDSMFSEAEGRRAYGFAAALARPEADDRQQTDWLKRPEPASPAASAKPSRDFGPSAPKTDSR